MKEGFIYIWLDKKDKRYYIGSHWGNIDDGYVCSSKWMKSAYKNRAHDFKRRILQTGIKQELLREAEYDWLSLIKKEELGTRYYNLNNSKILKPGNWPKDKKRSEDTKKKISDSLKGNVPWNRGKPMTDTQKEKLRHLNLGKTHSDETKALVSNSLIGNSRSKGSSHTDEWKLTQSIRLKENWKDNLERKEKQALRNKLRWAKYRLEKENKRNE